LAVIAVILIGYSSNAIIVIRSSANPPLNENNPSNPVNLLYFLNREQYGSRPLSREHTIMPRLPITRMVNPNMQLKMASILLQVMILRGV
jgi:hypothetical protein